MSNIIRRARYKKVTPSAPTAIVYDHDDPRGLRISWTGSTPNEAYGYEVSRSAGDSNAAYTVLKRTRALAHVVPRADIVELVPRYYRIKAYAANGAKSAAVALRVVYDRIPDAPTGLAGVFSDPNVDLTWTPNTEVDLAGYNVYRSDDDGETYALLDFVAVGTEEYSDETPFDGIAHYVIAATDTPGDNESEDSAVVIVDSSVA